MKKYILFLVFILSSFVCVFAQIPPQIAFNETANRLTVTSGLSLWFDAADMGSIVKDANNKVSLWQDKSGNNNHAVQATASSQPTYTTNTLNGLPSITFPGAPSAQFFIGSKTGSYQTIIAVRNVSSTTSSWQTLFAAPANSDFSFRLNYYYNGTTPNTAYDGGSNANDWTFNNSGKVYVNGVNISQVPPRPNYHIVVVESAVVQANLTFSISSGDTTSPWANRGVSNGSGICELIVFNRTITAIERQSIEKYLARKWKISITPALSVP